MLPLRDLDIDRGSTLSIIRGRNVTSLVPGNSFLPLLNFFLPFVNLRSAVATIAACYAAPSLSVIPLPFQRLAVRHRVVWLVTDRLSLTESTLRPVHGRQELTVRR
jgi:hypothetical protein